MTAGQPGPTPSVRPTSALCPSSTRPSPTGMARSTASRPTAPFATTSRPGRTKEQLSRHGDRRAPCPFYLSVEGRDPAARILCCDDKAVAFFPLEPATRGHTLVIPHRHVAQLGDFEPHEALDLAAAVQQVSAALTSALSPEVLNVIQSNGTAATQTVPHVHVHLVPSSEGDRMIFRWPDDCHSTGAGSDPRAPPDTSSRPAGRGVRGKPQTASLFIQASLPACRRHPHQRRPGCCLSSPRPGLIRPWVTLSSVVPSLCSEMPS